MKKNHGYPFLFFFVWRGGVRNVLNAWTIILENDTRSSPISLVYIKYNSAGQLCLLTQVFLQFEYEYLEIKVGVSKK